MGTIAVRLQTMRTLWGALMGSVILLDVALLRIPHEDKLSVPAHAPEMFALVAVAIAVVSLLFPRRMFRAAVSRLEVDITSEPGEAVSGFRDAPLLRRVVTNPQQVVVSALGAFGEAMKVSVPFFVAALLLMAVRYPRVETVTRAIEHSTGATCTL